MGAPLAELRTGILPDGWKSTFSTVDRAKELGQTPKRRVICHLSYDGRNGQDGIEVDQDGRVIGHEPRYIGGVLFTHSDVISFATIMGFPSAPQAHIIAAHMQRFEEAFLRRIDGGEHSFYANQNVWGDVYSIEGPLDQVGE